MPCYDAALPEPWSRSREIRAAASVPRSRGPNHREHPSELVAEHREIIGKKVATLRRAGKLPAVVYGHGHASEPIQLDAHEFDILRRHAGRNALLDLKVGRRRRPARAAPRGSRASRLAPRRSTPTSSSSA